MRTDGNDLEEREKLKRWEREGRMVGGEHPGRGQGTGARALGRWGVTRGPPGGETVPQAEGTAGGKAWARAGSPLSRPVWLECRRVWKPQQARESWKGLA